MNTRIDSTSAARQLESHVPLAPSIPVPGPASMIVPRERAAAPGLVSVSDALAELLARLGVEHAFGIFGGGIAPFCEALSRSPIRLLHFRHEAGAAFAAIESSLASGRLTVVFATTGPGLTNLYTGMVAARWEGARVLFVSGGTPAAQRGRGAFQDSDTHALPLTGPSAVFHHALSMGDPAELESFAARLATGIERPNGFVAHLSLPVSMQTARLSAPPRPRITSWAAAATDASSARRCAELLSSAPFVIWAGFGARHAAGAVRALAELTGARVICSPRAKGVMPEDHPLFLGVTGLGGYGPIEKYMQAERPPRVLVLGSRLGEFTSFWAPELVPSEGFVHVDLDADVFGAAYPTAPTLGVRSEVGAFLEALLASWPSGAALEPRPRLEPLPPALSARSTGPVRPSYLLSQIQREIVEQSDAVVLTEAGNSFALGTHHLRFNSANRYRVSTGFGSMGHAVAGVLGAALARRGKAVALVGDGAMLMQSEVSTAAQYGIDCVWIVLNDARYGMIAQGMQSIGWRPFEVDFPRVDFVSVARAMGADGVRVEREADVGAALRAAMAARGPFVVDVIIDPREMAPSSRRNQSLVKQGVTGSRDGL